MSMKKLMIITEEASREKIEFKQSVLFSTEVLQKEQKVYGDVIIIDISDKAALKQLKQTEEQYDIIIAFLTGINQRQIFDMLKENSNLTFLLNNNTNFQMAKRNIRRDLLIKIKDSGKDDDFLSNSWAYYWLPNEYRLNTYLDGESHFRTYYAKKGINFSRAEDRELLIEYLRFNIRIDVVINVESPELRKSIYEYLQSLGKEIQYPNIIDYKFFEIIPKLSKFSIGIGNIIFVDISLQDANIGNFNLIHAKYYSKFPIEIGNFSTLLGRVEFEEDVPIGDEKYVRDSLIRPMSRYFPDQFGSKKKAVFESIVEK